MRGGADCSARLTLALLRRGISLVAEPPVCRVKTAAARRPSFCQRRRCRRCTAQRAADMTPGYARRRYEELLTWLTASPAPPPPPRFLGSSPSSLPYRPYRRQNDRPPPTPDRLSMPGGAPGTAWRRRNEEPPTAGTPPSSPRAVWRVCLFSAQRRVILCAAYVHGLPLCCRLLDIHAGLSPGEVLPSVVFARGAPVVVSS